METVAVKKASTWPAQHSEHDGPAEPPEPSKPASKMMSERNVGRTAAFKPSGRASQFWLHIRMTQKNSKITYG